MSKLVTRKFAWKPDIPDHRDYYYTAPKAPKLPAYVDRIGMGNPIEDQGDLGSCTGNASTSALEIVTKSPQLSRLMAYYNGRAIEGTVPYDSGCYIRDVIKALSKTGCCNETLWPYVISKFATKPPASAYTQAAVVVPKVSSYQRALTLQDVKNALAQKLPVVFGFSVPQYFIDNTVATTGWVRLPTRNDYIIGGHATVAVGYDDRVTSANPKPFIWVRNSWGSSWGLQGYFKMDQAWFSDPRRLVDDMWVIIPKT